MSKYDLITHDYLLSILDYNKLTGVFTWKVNKHRAYAGDVAGCENNSGYIKIGINNHEYRAHRLAWFYVHGKWPTSDIDHIDMNKSNNAISNLRLASKTENRQHVGIRKHNKCGFKGVWFDEKRKHFRVEIKNNKKRIYLGSFATPEEAHAAYCEAAKKLHGEFARFI